MIKPTVPEVAPLVLALYNRERECTTGAGNVGGHLHVVLDDGNVETGFILYCLQNALHDACAPCAELAEKLLLMSETQRRKLYMLPKYL